MPSRRQFERSKAKFVAVLKIHVGGTAHRRVIHDSLITIASWGATSGPVYVTERTWRRQRFSLKIVDSEREEFVVQNRDSDHPICYLVQMTG